MMIGNHNLRTLCELFLLIAFIQPVMAQTPLDSILVVPMVSQNMAGTDPVLRFSFQGTGSVMPLSTIEPPTVVNSQYVTFNAQGELFVANRHDNFNYGSISRFKFNDDGSFAPNGVITGNGLIGVHGIAFSPSGELFANSLVYGAISRFLFDANGNAIPNGKLMVQPGIQGLAFNGEGEMFFPNQWTNRIYRYRFDASGNPVANGTIPTGSWGGGGISFNPSGEMFVADFDGYIHRFLFNANGNAVPNGTITSPIKFVAGVTFSQSGEMFLTGQQSSTIYRYLFDVNGNAVPHGSVSTSKIGFGMPAIYPSALSNQPCPEGALPNLSAGITKKSGAKNLRSWAITLSNKSGCSAENAQIDSLMLTQTFGSACTPVITSPLSFPLGVGNIPAESKASGTSTLDFTGCPNNARFKATIPFSSNNGEVNGSKTLNNQFR